MRSFLAAVALAALCAHAARASPSSARAPGPPGLSDLANAEQCVCQSPDAQKQLIRGAGQVERCQQGYYCDCLSKTVQKCDGILPMFTEDVEDCGFSYDCEEFFNGPIVPTDGPSTASPAPTRPTEPETAAPDVPTAAPEPCTCKDALRHFQLIRGPSQVDQCQQGYYCNCLSKTVQKCDGVLPMFNEDVEDCGFSYDCKAYLEGTTLFGV